MKAKVQTTYTLELDEEEMRTIVRWAAEAKKSRSGLKLTWKELDGKIEGALLILLDPEDDV